MKDTNQDPSYEAALKAVAAEVGLRPDEFARQLEKEAQNFSVTRECLTLDEIGTLTVTRSKHVAKCSFCLMLLYIASPSDREVANFVRSAVRPDSESPRNLRTLEREVNALERDMILQALKAHAGNTRRAAEALGISSWGLRWRQLRYRIS